MQIVIHCGGMPFNGSTIKEKSLGGSETAAYYMALELTKQGHEVLMFTNHQEGGTFDGVAYAFAGQQSEQYPLGDQFYFYATNTPHDVLIIQRGLMSFNANYASKINILWLHDLALHRQSNMFGVQMWNVDAIFTVSEYHKQQVVDVYGVNPDIVMPITNGVDLSLYEGLVNNDLYSMWYKSLGNPDDEIDDEIDFTEYEAQIKLIYSSRPERGLENLVMPDGIMERLYKINPKYHLYVCTYNNVTPQMKPLYDYLWQRCDELPNVTNVGNLTKQQLADVQRQCIACVYPTTFEEVSCITAMECMAAGIGFVSSEHAALPETCKGSGANLIPLKKDGSISIGKFVHEIKEGVLPIVKELQLGRAEHYDWFNAADMVDDYIITLFKKRKDFTAISNQLMYNSDIYALKEHSKNSGIVVNPILKSVLDELKECYEFTTKDDWGPHYEAYYKYEKERGVNYGPEDLSHNNRFQCVSNLIADHIDRSDYSLTILDYGCAHGHYTINLAKRFPDHRFVGVDIAASNITKARKWAADEGIKNVEFFVGQVSEKEISIVLDEEQRDKDFDKERYDIALAAEVIEHVADSHLITSALRHLVDEDGRVIITTPYGGWEAIGYKEHWPWRAHVWHFDRNDINRMYRHLDNFKLITVPSGKGKQGEPIGSYVYEFSPSIDRAMGPLMDLPEKLNTLVPRQTLSLCMIVKDGAKDILRCLESVKDIVDEVIIGLDKTTTDDTWNICRKFCVNNHISLDIWTQESPIKTGFDIARNSTIERASGQWIMWMDADEILHHPENLHKYLRNNQFNGYAIKQHHLAVEPLGLLKTDLPCRIFRNHEDIEFFGVVHEHPEKKLNEGVGHVTLIHDICIEHHGYPSEDVRRRRFARNIELMARDREKYPKRHLGKFLWLRDLSQLNTYELEQNGHHITPVMHHRAIEGIRLWEELLVDGQLRMLADGMQFYSALVSILGEGFDFSFALKGSKLNGGADLNTAAPITARFLNKKHLADFMSAYTEQELKNYESRYF